MRERTSLGTAVAIVGIVALLAFGSGVLVTAPVSNSSSSVVSRASTTLENPGTSTFDAFKTGSVAFEETGLPYLWVWDVTLNGQTYTGFTAFDDRTMLWIADVHYGERYEFSVRALFYSAHPSDGIVYFGGTVDGLGSVIHISFSPS